MSRRTERVGEQIRAELARILREDVSDPRLERVTLSHVNVSPDLSRADVFWSKVEPGGEPEDPGALDEVLEKASGFVRTRLARSLNLRRTPRLYFRHDPSFELGSRTLSLLRSLRDEPSEP